MCKPYTYTPVTNSQFESWKKNAIAKGIEMTGENSGDLKWGPVAGTFAWTLDNLALKVELKIASTENNCRGMYYELGNMIPAEEKPGSSTPPGPALSINDEGKYTVIGRVLSSGNVLAGVRVQAWDEDQLGPDDKLGQDHTDENGFFTIEFDPSAFNDWGLDRDPDLYFKVFDDKDLIGDSSGATIKNAKPGIEDIVINLRR